MDKGIEKPDIYAEPSGKERIRPAKELIQTDFSKDNPEKSFNDLAKAAYPEQEAYQEQYAKELKRTFETLAKSIFTNSTDSFKALWDYLNNQNVVTIRVIHDIAGNATIQVDTRQQAGYIAFEFIKADGSKITKDRLDAVAAGIKQRMAFQSALNLPKIETK